jgi:hypothetical protein
VLPLGAVVLLGVLTLTAPGGDLEGVGSERHGPAGGVDDQQLFLDTQGSHPSSFPNGEHECRTDPAHPPLSSYIECSTVIPNIHALISVGPSVPLPLVTIRRRPRFPRLVMRRPEGAVRSKFGR